MSAAVLEFHFNKFLTVINYGGTLHMLRIISMNSVIPRFFNGHPSFVWYDQLYVLNIVFGGAEQECEQRTIGTFIKFVSHQQSENVYYLICYFTFLLLSYALILQSSIEVMLVHTSKYEKSVYAFSVMVLEPEAVIKYFQCDLHHNQIKINKFMCRLYIIVSNLFLLGLHDFWLAEVS